MKAICTALFSFIVAALLSSPASATSIVLPQFEDFPAQIYYGPASGPDLNSDPDAYTYRTRLRNAAQGPVNFAGEHIIATWGCGTTCLMGAAINVRTGAVRFLPGTVCCWDGSVADPIAFRSDSNLLVLTGLINEQDPMASNFYEFSGGEFRLIYQQGAIPAPPQASPPPPIASSDAVPSSTQREPSSGAVNDVTEFTLYNDLNTNIAVSWLNGQGLEQWSEGGDQTQAHPWVGQGESWRVERGARTWESHWYAIASPNGFYCSFSPRQGGYVSLSGLSACRGIAGN